MAVAKDRTCSTCAAWDRGSQRCRLHPPVMIETRHGLVTQWPETGGGEWCLQHVGREKTA